MRIRKLVVGGLVIAVVGVASIYAMLLIWAELQCRGLARTARVKLLYETDHKALLQACRELSQRATSGELKPNMYGVRTARDREVSTFPRVILDLLR